MIFVFCSCFGREETKRPERLLPAPAESDCRRGGNTRSLSNQVSRSSALRAHLKHNKRTHIWNNYSEPVIVSLCFCLHRTQPSKVSKDMERTSPVPSSKYHDNIPSSCSDNEEGQEQKSGFNKSVTGSAHSKRQYRQRSPSSGSGEEREKERERDRHKKSHRNQDRERDRDRDRDRNRGRERDDRHGGRRDDRDRRKDRERDRGREDDRSRGKRDTEREDRHEMRDRSPRERDRDKNGQREKRRNSDEDKRKDKDREEEKERRKEPEKEKAAKGEGKDPEKKEHRKEKEDEQRQEGKEKEEVEVEEKVNKFAKRSTDQTLSSARDRYMARQMARSACKTYIEKDED